MNTIQKPTVLEAANNPGLEGYVPIDESNITIGTYTNIPRFVASIHSCADFDCEAVLDVLMETYQCTNIKYQYLYESQWPKYPVARSNKTPHSIQQ